MLAKMAYRDEPEGVLAVFEIAAAPAPGRRDPARRRRRDREARQPRRDGAHRRRGRRRRLLVADGEVDPWNPNAIRASTGAVFTLPIVEATRDDVASLPQQKVAAVLGAATRHSDADLTRPTAFLIGAEDAGLDAAWRETADLQVAIPMSGAAADSLNASAAAAVLLFEAVRQRGLGR